jgi:WhiB family transcriptional regulator, redox-sensing transcriptional regulator
MTRARTPRPHEVAAARRDPRLIRAFSERRESDHRTDDAWRSRGVCRRHDPETFFPAPSETPEAALSLCRGCDVQGACLAWALDAGDGHGVWGATTPRERRAMAVVWRDEAPVAEAARSVLGEVVILAAQREPIIAEALNHAVRVAS